jgi:hypothetical protein
MLVAGCPTELSSIDLETDEIVVKAPGGYVTFNATRLTIDPISIRVGESQQVIKKILPENASDRRATYSMDKPEIASVTSEGVITGHAEGTTTITVILKANGLTATTTVSVLPPGPDDIAVSAVKVLPETLTLTIGDTSTLEATDPVTWESSAPGIATVDPVTGVVTGVAVGQAVITATAGAQTATCTVTVVLMLPVASILGGVTVTGYPSCEDRTFKLEWTAAPAGTTQSAIDAAMDAALEQWKTYLRYIDPLPFYDDVTTSTGIAPVREPDVDPSDAPAGGGAWEVAIGLKLDNSDPGTYGNLVIHRYWPAGILTGSAWLASRATAQVAAFNAELARIQAMMTAIAASPLYAAGNGLDTLYESMEKCTEPDTTTTPLPLGLFMTGASNTARQQGGFLYEYYLGLVPPSSVGSTYMSGAQYPFP